MGTQSAVAVGTIVELGAKGEHRGREMSRQGEMSCHGGHKESVVDREGGGRGAERLYRLRLARVLIACFVNVLGAIWRRPSIELASWNAR